MNNEVCEETDVMKNIGFLCIYEAQCIYEE